MLRIVILLAVVASPGVTQASPSQAEVPPANLANLKVSDFADDEIDLPYYLANFHRVANSVPLEGDLRGWITVSVWRGDSNQRTYNARVLESQLSLAYFYCIKRPWNPYRGQPAVRARLEAVLERWCDMQSSEGKFSEYGEKGWGLAPTAFATKFTSETLRLLAQGPPIDAQLHERVKRALRKAILITLTDPVFWRHGRICANQFSNVFAGGLAWLALFPDDEEVRAQLLKRMKEASTELQSPAGYFYEGDGADWHYNLGTHHSNLHVAWHYARGTAFEPLVLAEVRRFYDWMSWNAVIEPDGSGFVLNRAIEVRKQRPWVAVEEERRNFHFSFLPQAELIEPARAFLPSREQEASARTRLRVELELNWPKVPALKEGEFDAYTPYAFLHRSMVHWLPTVTQQMEARSRLPYLRDGRHAHLRADNRHDVCFLYVRRPNYYLAFNAGKRISGQQRYGPGLLWSPGLGSLAQNQTGSDDNTWGATKLGEKAPYEARDVTATIKVDGKALKRVPGSRDLDDGDVTITYALGETGRKTISFEDDRIRIQTEHPGNFFESVPLLTRDEDRLRIEQNRFLLERAGKVVLAIEFDPVAAAELLNAGGSVGPYQVRTVRIKATARLAYAIVITPSRSGVRRDGANQGAQP